MSRNYCLYIVITFSALAQIQLYVLTLWLNKIKRYFQFSILRITGSMRSQFTQGKIAVIQIHQLYAYKTGLKGHNLNVSKRRNWVFIIIYHREFIKAMSAQWFMGIYEPRLQWKEWCLGSMSKGLTLSHLKNRSRSHLVDTGFDRLKFIGVNRESRLCHFIEIKLELWKPHNKQLFVFIPDFLIPEIRSSKLSAPNSTS